MKYWGSQPQSKSSQHSRALNADVLTKVMLESLNGSEKKSFFSPSQNLEIKSIWSPGTLTDPCQYTYIHRHRVIPLSPALPNKFSTLWGINSTWKVPPQSCMLPGLVVQIINCVAAEICRFPFLSHTYSQNFTPIRQINDTDVPTWRPFPQY